MLFAAQPAWGTIAALALFIVASMWIGMLANRAMREGSFLKGFFLGNRGLGPWALALTATVQSGGTFMGFPSLVYSHGWSVALWIAGYMVVPITGFGILGKRLAQISRTCSAITVPDLFRERFGSRMLGLIASLFILFYMSFMMVAQFKAGAIVMKIAWLGHGSYSEDQAVGRYEFSVQALERIRGHAKLAPFSKDFEKLAGKSYSTDAALDQDLSKCLNADDLKSLRPAVLRATKLTDWPYIVGLAVFTLSVILYTMLGGFLAAVWTDLFQSVMMWVGVIALLILSLIAVVNLQRADAAKLGNEAAASPMNPLEYASRKAVEQTSPDFAFAPGYDGKHERRRFLTPGLAMSFFWIWVFAGVGSPAGMVRIMASRNTANIRRSIYLLGAYNACIYIPLVAICICGRAILPNIPVGKTDEIIPELALNVTSHLPLGQFWSGLILAAPFGAVMATVSSYLVVIASGLVRDVYQGFVRPRASQGELQRVSQAVMIVVGAVAVLANIEPVDYLQAIVVFSGSGAAATFCVPALMLAYWRRSTVPGTIAGMLAGAGTLLVLYAIGFQGDTPSPVIQSLLDKLEVFGITYSGVENSLLGPSTRFRPFFLMGVDPLVWGLTASLIAGVLISLLTKPCENSIVAKFFEVDSLDSVSTAGRSAR